MAKKKDLTGAITRGADRFFSANDKPQEAQEELQDQEAFLDHEGQQAQETRKPYKAQEASQEQLAAVVQEMQAHIEAQEARQTQGRKGFKMPRMNMSFTPSNMDYLKTMASIHSMSITRYLNHIIERHAEVNAARYQKAKEFLRDA